jgi:uncharacterized protein (UPF0276 family)
MTASSSAFDPLRIASARGASFSYDAAKGLAEAEAIADRVGAAATWYSVGILSHQEDLAHLFAEFCRRRKLHALFHPLDLDICGTDPLEPEQLRALAARARELDAPWLNVDLAMWCRNGEALLEALLPMPLVDEAVEYTADRVKHAQDILQRPLTIENPPYLFKFGDGDMLQLMDRIAARADCLMTIDVGHLYGLRRLQGRPLIMPSDDDLDWNRVVEVHMSGTYDRLFPEEIVVDDKHDWPVDSKVWDMAMELIPRAKNLRAVLAEGEGLSADELAASVLRFSNAFRGWWAS